MDIRQLVSQMTLEEKAGLCSGLDFWHSKPVERLDIPSVMMTDGPHGLRKQTEDADHLGLNESKPATCFPAGCATACSFDEDLLTELGRALGEECRAERVSMVLGPSLNIKRSPLCGRNFEYFSEDPFLSGRLAAAHVKGVQSMNVAACPKHFAANNQENHRMTQDSVVDERTLREIYLSAFEQVVKQAEPWSIMCSYNRLNGEYASHHPWLLTRVLRDEWGFKGFVVSDWGAVNGRVAGLAAGLDLEMPYSGGFTDREIVDAVRSGALSESVLDTAVERMLGVFLRTRKDQGEAPPNKLDEHNELAARIAAESAVLLKNDGALPLKEGQDVCFIGEFFEKPRIQGGGSSHINAYKITSARDMLKGAPYAPGFRAGSEAPDDALERAALQLARAHETAVVFLGLPDVLDSEGYDREHMALPENQNRLMEGLLALKKRVVVVLSNGAPVEMPWAPDVDAILEMYLGGQATGRAAVELLYGLRNPCGKLAETMPLKLADTPCHPWYNLDGDHVPYREGVFVGYRYYDKKRMNVLFPFGHGLSYTEFAYGDLRLDREETDGPLAVSVTVRNVGAARGKEVVQLYVSPPKGRISRPEQELKGFAKVELEPGESKTVTMALDRRAFAVYSVAYRGWFVQPGEYQIRIGKSSRRIELERPVRVTSNDRIPLNVTRDTTIGDLMQYPQLAEMFQQLLAQSPLGQGSGAEGEDGTGLGMMFQRMLGFFPLRQLSMMGVAPDQIDGLIERIKAIVE